MSYLLKLGDKVRLKYEYQSNFDYLYGLELTITELSKDDIYLSSHNDEIVFSAYGLNHMFELIGNNVNNEAFDFIRKNEIKSFQAILNDGRVINISCLN